MATETLSRVQEAIERVDLAVERVQQLQLAVESAKDELRQLVGESRLLPSDERYTIVRLLYWGGGMKPRDLAAALGVKHNELVAMAGPVQHGTCLKCGGPLHAGTRNQLEIGVCSTCKDAEEADRLHREHLGRESWAAEQRRKQYLRTMPYEEYLKTPEWQQKRQEAIRRARGRCQLCNADNNGRYVHHRTYERRGDEWLQDLIVLCRRCHEHYHVPKGR